MDYREKFKKEISIYLKRIHSQNWRDGFTGAGNKLKSFGTIELRKVILETAEIVRDKSRSIHSICKKDEYNRITARGAFHEIIARDVLMIASQLEQLEQNIPNMLKAFKEELEEADKRKG